MLPLPRTTLTLALMLAPILATAPLAAQQQGGSWQLRIPSGRMIVTGDQRNAIKDAPVIALQVARTIGASTAVTSTIGWARSRDLGHPDSPKLDILSGDLGLERRVSTWRLGKGTSFTPFVGVGGGVRRYDSRLQGARATTAVARYLAAGGELGIGRVGIRLELRDYATDARGATGLRNDVAIMGALRFNRQRVP